MAGDRPDQKRFEDTGSVDSTGTLSDQSALTDRNSNVVVQLDRSRQATCSAPDLQLVETATAFQAEQPLRQGKDVTKAGDEHIKGKGGESVRKTTDGKYFVTGADGVEREFVQSDKYVQTPGTPNRWPLDGGAVDNRSDKPILVLGKGVGHPGNEHGDGYLRILPPNTKTDGSKNDYDGIVTDPRFQPVVLPDGKVLMPAKVDADAQWLKVPDRNTGVVAKDGKASNEAPLLPPWGTSGTFQIKDYTGGRAVTPESPETRKRDEDAEDKKR